MQPFDTVRRRMMLESEKKVADRIYKGSFDCFKQVMAKEGLKGMYKGAYQLTHCSTSHYDG